MNQRAELGHDSARMLAPIPSVTFRRGWFLTLAVVVGTALIYLWMNLPGLWFGRSSHKASQVIFGCAALGLLCRFVLLGGRGSTGCLGMIYVSVFVPVALTAAFLAFTSIIPGSSGPSMKSGGLEFHNLGYDLGNTLGFCVTGAWTGFACWVLFLSGDVRAYREARRYGEAAKEDAALDDWPGHLR